MSPDMEKIYREIVELSITLKKRGTDLFVTYSPHVQNLHIHMHVNGWVKGNEADYSEFVELDFEGREVSTLVEMGRRVIDEIKQAIQNKKDEYSAKCDGLV